MNVFALKNELTYDCKNLPRETKDDCILSYVWIPDQVQETVTR